MTWLMRAYSTSMRPATVVGWSVWVAQSCAAAAVACGAFCADWVDARARACARFDVGEDDGEGPSSRSAAGEGEGKGRGRAVPGALACPGSVRLG